MNESTLLAYSAQQFAILGEHMPQGTVGKELARKQDVSFSKYMEMLVYQDSLCNKSVE